MGNPVKLFGDKLYIPVDVITAENVEVTFKNNRKTVCNAIQLQGQRPFQRVVDLSTGDAIAVTGPYSGQLSLAGVVVPGFANSKLTDFLNEYIDFCGMGNDGNAITLKFKSACDSNKYITIKAKGCLLIGHGVNVQVGEGINVVSSLAFFVSGVEIAET